MDKFVIHGGHRLTGEIEVSGAKNAAVALIPAVLLCDEPCILENVPDISDVSISLRIMSEWVRRWSICQRPQSAFLQWD